MDEQHRFLLVVAATVFSAIGFFPYIWATYTRKIQPSKASWLIWFTLTVLTAAGMYQADALNAQVIVYLTCDIVLVPLVLLYGTPGWSRLDMMCIAGAIVGIMAWVVTQNPNWAVVMALTVITIGSIPTFTKTWHDPQSENWWGWFTALMGSILQSMAIPAWTIADASPPLTYVVIQATVCWLMLSRPKRLRPVINP